MKRRHLLAAGGAALARPAHALDFAAPRQPAAMRASLDRIIDIAVGIRPFRAQGPRIEAERRFGKTIVHHYGHGGSGWSLSWGSAQRALALIQASGAKPGERIAVIGAGAIGLTTARLIPQPEVGYALIYRGHNLVVLPRRDGLLVAAMGEHDFGSDELRPDQAQSEAAVQRLAGLF